MIKNRVISSKSELELRVLYVVIKIMMYDVLLQIIEIFPFNNVKMYDGSDKDIWCLIDKVLIFEHFLTM